MAEPPAGAEQGSRGPEAGMPAAEEPAARQPFRFTAPLSVCLDVKHPQAYLALGPVRALADELSLTVDWLPFAVPALNPPPPAAAGDDRSTRHRRARARYLQADLERYARSRGLELRAPYRCPDSTLFCLGLLWLRKAAPEQCAGYLEHVFRGYWEQTLDVEDAAAVAAVIGMLGADAETFAAFAAGPGKQSLAALRDALVAAGVFTVPSLVVEDEVFVGREHLPMVRWRLTGCSGPPPI